MDGLPCRSDAGGHYTIGGGLFKAEERCSRANALSWRGQVARACYTRLGRENSQNPRGQDGLATKGRRMRLP